MMIFKKIADTATGWFNKADEYFVHTTDPEYKSSYGDRLGLLWFILIMWIIFDGVWLWEADIVVFGDMDLSELLGLAVLGAVLLFILWHFVCHVRAVAGFGRKILYAIYILYLGPAISLWILPVVYLLPYVLYLLITAVMLFFGILLSVLSGDGFRLPKKFRLDNGDGVRVKSGLFGEKSYEGDSGKSYETNDGGRTFTEK